MQIKLRKEEISIVLFTGLFFTLLPIFNFIYNHNQLKTMDSYTFSNDAKFKYISGSRYGRYDAKYYYKVKNNTYYCEPTTSFLLFPSDNQKKIYYKSYNPSDCFVEQSKLLDTALIVLLVIGLTMNCIVLISLKNK